MVHSKIHDKENEVIESMFIHLLHQVRTINRIYTIKVDEEINDNYTRIVSHFNDSNLEKTFLTNKLPM